jgi:penicillin-binding protein 1A
VQAKRQPGSSFKPFVYSAALEHGFNPATLVNDAPIVFGQVGTESEWRPENNSGEFNGPTRLREGLVKSLNLVSIRVLQRMGVGPAIRHIKPFGLPDSVMPRNFTMALGSGAATPLEMATGFAAFANGGHRVDSYLIDRIVDSRGKTLFKATPKIACSGCGAAVAPSAIEGADGAAGPDGAAAPVSAAAPGSEPPATALPANQPTAAPGGALPLLPVGQRAPRVISAENGYLMYDMMRDVIRRGTGRRALALGRNDLAGKTGTSNERRDTWFTGFNGRLVATAWVGFDQERGLGEREEGSRTALPMWIYYMDEALRGQGEAPLPRPDGIVTARISAATGQLSANGIFEIFRESDLLDLGTELSGADSGSGEVAPGASSDDIF